MVDIGEALKRLFTNQDKRYIIGEAENDVVTAATVIYDDKSGSPAENKPFVIPSGTTPPPGEIVVSIEYSPVDVQVGTTVNLNGSKTKPSSENSFITSWQWNVRNEGGTQYPVVNPQTPLAAFVMPDLNWAYVTLSVTDSNGKTGVREIKILVDQTPPPPPPPPTEKILPIVSVTASAQDSGKEANLVTDGNFETRWSSDGDGQYIEFTFDKIYEVTKVRLTGFHYDKTYNFEINGKRFENLAGRPPNTLIEYDLTSLGIVSNKVRIIGHGNNSSTYNSYREIEFKGFESGPPPPPPPPGDPLAVITPENPTGAAGSTITVSGQNSVNAVTNNWSVSPSNQVVIVGPNTQQTANIQILSALPGSTVTLTVGNGLGKTNSVTKNITVFTVPPPPPPGTLVRLLGFGDNDTTSGAKQVLTAMMKVPEVAEYEFLGDGPYDKDASDWISMMKNSFNTPEKLAKLRLSQGNHEHKESESQGTEDQIEEWLPHLRNTNDQLDWLSAGKVGNVYVISGNTQDLDVEFKRDQFNWLKGELEKAKALRTQGQIDWIVYLAHKPFFTLKSSHSPYTAVRNNYKEIFRDAQVDFVLHGHNHNTQLWLPMIPNQSDANGEGEQLFSLMPDGKTFDFTKDHGWLGIVSGHAGHEWNGINDTGTGVKNVMHYRDSGKFGFTQLDFVGKKVNVKSIDSDGKVHYEYNVSRESGSPPPPPPPPPPDDPVAKIIAPSQVLGGSNVLLDGSQSVADSLTITQTAGQIVNLVDAGVFKKSFTAPNGDFSLGFQGVAIKGTKQAITQIAIQVSTNLPPPPGEVDEHGTKMLYKPTGKRVQMKKGTDHRNGQRYNVNHKFTNYMMIGYYKTGNGQEKLEMKTDGPNHGGCDQLPECMWYEPSIVVNTGEVELGGEWPHPDNHNNLPTDFKEKLAKPIKEQWVGYAVIAYTNKNGNRVVEQWDALDPFDMLSGKPTNNWHLNLKVEDTKGKVFPSQYHPRMPPINFDEGLESEIRMHRGTNGDTEMKWTYVYEIVPPTN